MAISRRFMHFISLDKQILQRKIVNVLLFIILAYVLGAQKNRLIETVLSSTNNICFGSEIRCFPQK